MEHITRVIKNSIDCLTRENIGHSSVPYNSMGIHLACNKVKTASSEAERPTLLYTAFRDRKDISTVLSLGLQKSTYAKTFGEGGIEC